MWPAIRIHRSIGSPSIRPASFGRDVLGGESLGPFLWTKELVMNSDKNSGQRQGGQQSSKSGQQSGSSKQQGDANRQRDQRQREHSQQGGSSGRQGSADGNARGERDEEREQGEQDNKA